MVAAQRVRTVLATSSTGPLGSSASAAKRMADSRSHYGAGSTPSPACASALSHNGDPRVGVMRGGSVSSPMWSSICRMSALCVMVKSPRQFPVWGFNSVSAEADYFFAGGKSVQLPCATSAAMPMLSPSVG